MDAKQQIKELLKSADEPARNVIGKVIALERDNLDLQSPRGMKAEVVKLVKDHVR